MSLNHVYRTFCRLCLLTLVIVQMSCTTIGAHDQNALSNINFGPPETVRICVLMDGSEISEVESSRLVQFIRNEFILYGIQVEVPWYRRWQRPAGGSTATLEDLAERRLQPPCDRLLALAGENTSDLIDAVLGVNVLGAVDTVTHTRGYVLCENTCVNQLIAQPTVAIIHESYHLLGCGHDLSMTTCYERIRQLKIAARQNRENGNDFFPTFTRNGVLIFRREDVNRLESMALKVQRAKN